MKLNAKELRDLNIQDLPEQIHSVGRAPVYLILENVYDTYNIGGLFRLADALNISKMYICGQTEIPPNPKIKKASIGTYKIVPWEYKSTALEVISQLRAGHPQGIQIVAVEQDKRSVDYRTINYTVPIALLVGNETSGVLPETLEAVDTIAEIPMWGINKSLNVIVSAAIVSYHIMAYSEAKKA